MSGSNKMHPISDEYGRIKNFDFCSEVEPTLTWAYMTWINPLTQEIQVRNKTNTAWISVGGGGGGSHHETHEDGGDDEISVAGLSGELADGQPPKAHKTSHQDGGTDELDVTGLAGAIPQNLVGIWLDSDI